jgi:hypothetical protein
MMYKQISVIDFKLSKINSAQRGSEKWEGGDKTCGRK